MQTSTASSIRIVGGEPQDPLVLLERELLGFADGLPDVDVARLVERVRRTAPSDADLDVLRDLAVHEAAGWTFEEPSYSALAARILALRIREEVHPTGAGTFSGALARARAAGLVCDRLWAFVDTHHVALDAAIRPERDRLFTWFGLKTVQDRYLVRHPQTRRLLETPQGLFMRVACAISDDLDDALALYDRYSRLEVLPSSPTLFNAGTAREQLSSCFLLDSPKDDLIDIYKKYADVARLSKYAGGIGLAYHRVRSEGSHIRGTNGHSRGIVPFLKTLDASVAAVNQGGRRKGACCVYLEPWHADVEAFLELRDNTGDEARRTHNLNLANWIPDLFMRRVEADQLWSLFDPKELPELVDTWGSTFDAIYERAEAEGRFVRQVRARDLYGRMMRTLAQTGNGWMCFKDASNRTCNQTAQPGNVVHLSNLCTEILEVSSEGECAVCNLASINLSRHLDGEAIDWTRLAETVRHAVGALDRVIDRNLYTIDEARTANMRWRPVGLGAMGLQDVLFKLRLPFDSAEARQLSTQLQAWIYYHATSASADRAKAFGEHPAFAETRAAGGVLQPDLWGVSAEDLPGHDTQGDLFRDGIAPPALDWDALRAKVRDHGLRNSLLVAIAPTATIAAIAGCFECIEPQVSNLFKRETLSGEFIQVNPYLVAELKRLGQWSAPVRDHIKSARGSVQGLPELPEATRHLFRTSWELSMRSLIDMAAERGPFIDQSQSLNLFVESPSISTLASMYMYAWKRGLKTTYYLRSRPATAIAMATASERATMCSLENPESCEACQ